jgi:hypothetical protein
VQLQKHKKSASLAWLAQFHANTAPGLGRPTRGIADVFGIGVRFHILPFPLVIPCEGEQPFGLLSLLLLFLEHQPLVLGDYQLPLVLNIGALAGLEESLADVQIGCRVQKSS